MDTNVKSKLKLGTGPYPRFALQVLLVVFAAVWSFLRPDSTHLINTVERIDFVLIGFQHHTDKNNNSQVMTRAKLACGDRICTKKMNDRGVLFYGGVKHTPSCTRARRIGSCFFSLSVV